MQPYEKYFPVRVNKDIAPDALQRGERRYVPGEMRDALNCRYLSTNGKIGVLSSTPGNILKTFALASGVNTCIGTFFSEKTNTIIYFIHNDEGNHKVVEYTNETGVFATLLAGSSLNFDKSFYISHGGIIDDLLIWADRKNPIRQISIPKAKAGFYVAPYSKYALSLATRPPLDIPFFSYVNDPTVVLNYVNSSTWQFAARYVYYDNRISTFGPLSVLALNRPVGDPSNTTKNAIDVNMRFPAELTGIVKAVDMAFRDSNTGSYFIFASHKNPSAQFTVRFTNTGRSIPVSTIDQIRPYDFIPSLPAALEVIKSRVFVPLNNTGFDVPDTTFELEFTLGSEKADLYANNPRYFKEGGSYVAGIVFYDDYGRYSFVKKTSKITIPYSTAFSTGGLDGTAPTVTDRYLDRKFINWQLTGTPPPGFAKYAIVISKNRFQSIYFQCKTVIHAYQGELTVNGELTDFDTLDYYSFKGHIFITPAGLNRRGLNPSVAYLQIPLNTPFVPDSTCLVRFLNNDFTIKRICRIVSVVGDFIVVDIRLFDYTSIENFAKELYIEVFRPAEGNDIVFYEVGNIFDIVNDGFPVTSRRMNGDTYMLNGNGYNLVGNRTGAVGVPNSINGGIDFNFVYDQNIDGGDAVNGGVREVEFITQALKDANRLSMVIESPTILTSAITIQTATALQSSSDGGRDRSQAVSSTEVSVQTTVYSLNYNKIASDYGRAHTIFEEEKKLNLFSTLGFSSPYIQNSYINGLNVFEAENNYPLPVERGPISLMKKVDQVLLSVHERVTTTLYIGEGFIRQGDDFILAVTQSVVGDDRQLSESYGTINPESFVSAHGLGFWWDALNGAVVQYSKGGLYPISNYGMRDYFYQKGVDYFPFRDSVKIVSGFDFRNDELIIAFPTIKDAFGGVIIQGETWAFNLTEKSWATRYSYEPEMLARINNQFISFKNGALWLHDKNSVYNNFYGVQYQRSFKIIANPYLGKDKRWLNAHIKGSLCASPSSDFRVIRIAAPSGQASYIPAYEFELDQGMWTAAILKNTNSPVEAGAIALRSGDDLYSNYIEVEVVTDLTNEAQMSQLNIVYKTEEFSV